MLNFDKKVQVGIAISAENGLEVAQIDYAARKVIKYGQRPLTYDFVRNVIADMDIFKNNLQELFAELQIPVGAEVYLTLPTSVMHVNDYPATLNINQVQSLIETEIEDENVFTDDNFNISASTMPVSTIQFNKIAYVVAQKSMLIEIAIQIKELGYSLKNIDVSTNSILNSLIFNGRVDISQDSMWTLVIVDSNRLNIVAMQGKVYMDCYSVPLGIGEVLGEKENYETVLSAIAPILNRIPSQYLYIVSKTNLISAQELSKHVNYNSTILYQEASNLATEPFIDVDEDIPLKNVSLDVIGAAIKKTFEKVSVANFNLFNKELGDVFLSEQPPIIKLGNKEYELSIENMIKASIVYAVIFAVIFVMVFILMQSVISNKKKALDALTRDINTQQQFINANKDFVSTKLFDEGDEVAIGLVNNKSIYTYYTIVGTEIPQKLWLTYLNLGGEGNTTISGQAENLESVYSFYRNIKDYDADSKLKLQRLNLATKSSSKSISPSENFEVDSILTSLNADYYEFKISDVPEEEKVKVDAQNENGDSKSNSKGAIPNLEPIE